MKFVYLILAVAFALAALLIAGTFGSRDWGTPHVQEQIGEDPGGGTADAATAAAREAGVRPEVVEPASAERAPDDWSTVDNPDARPPVPLDETVHTRSR
jgi:hypothetical protein